MIHMKISPRVFNQIFNIFIILIFIASYLKIDENLTNYINDYSTMLIVIYILSLSIILNQIIRKTYDSFRKNNLEKKSQAEFKHLLNNFDFNEKYILSLFLDKETTELALDPKNPTIQLLESKKIIINTAKVSENKKIFQIHSNIYQSLKNNPNILY
jgi:hypothetical protein